MVKPGDKECLLSLRLHTSDGRVNLISTYVLTLTSLPETKEELYTNLSNLIKNINSNEHLVLLGDFNARVGADHVAWPSCLGPFGVGKINKNGQLLLELCSYHGLCFTNSYFQTNPQLKVSRQHPRCPRAQ